MTTFHSTVWSQNITQKQQTKKTTPSAPQSEMFMTEKWTEWGFRRDDYDRHMVFTVVSECPEAQAIIMSNVLWVNLRESQNNDSFHLSAQM